MLLKYLPIVFDRLLINQPIIYADCFMIIVSFASILTDHATVTHKGNTITILAHPDAKLVINGKPATEETEIHHNDR